MDITEFCDRGVLFAFRFLMTLMLMLVFTWLSVSLLSKILISPALPFLALALGGHSPSNLPIHSLPVLIFCGCTLLVTFSFPSFHDITCCHPSLVHRPPFISPPLKLCFPLKPILGVILTPHSLFKQYLPGPRVTTIYSSIWNSLLRARSSCLIMEHQRV